MCFDCVDCDIVFYGLVICLMLDCFWFTFWADLVVYLCFVVAVFDWFVCGFVFYGLWFVVLCGYFVCFTACACFC